MSKGSKRRPFDRKKYDEGHGRAFGFQCSQCGANVHLADAKPLHEGQGETGVLCPECRDKFSDEALRKLAAPLLKAMREAK